MLQTLPLVLYVIMVELCTGSVAALVLLDWRNEVKRGFLISHALFYLALAGLTYLFQQNFASRTLLDSYTQIDKAWTGFQGLSLIIFFLLLLLYTLMLIFDKSAGMSGNIKSASAPLSGIRFIRLLSGMLSVVAGVVWLLALAMIFRPLASANLSGFFTVASFFAAALALGGVMTAMWLGHWYLVTPALSERPLVFSTVLVLIGLVAQLIFFFAIGPSTTYVNKPLLTSGPTSITAAPPTSASAHVPGSQVKPAGAPVITPLSTGAIGWLRIVVGFVMPLVFCALSWKLARERSFQSATGMLYLVVVCTLAGEAMARALFLMGL
jgi:hypothetical protein